MPLVIGVLAVSGAVVAEAGSTPGWIGTIPSWATLLSLLVIGYIFLKGGTGTAVSGLQDTNQELVRQLEKAKRDLADRDNTIRELRGQKDVSEAIRPLMQWADAHTTLMTSWMEGHDRRANENQEALLTSAEKMKHSIDAQLPVLEMIAENLSEHRGDGSVEAHRSS